MAQRTIVTVLDDLDQSEGASTVSFGLDGRQYEIDLAEKNAKKLEKLLAPYIQAGRRVGGRSASRATGSSGRSDLQAIRMWAQAEGYEVAERGRISADLMAAYDAAH